MKYARISNIYEGPESFRSSNGTSKAMAKRQAGSKSKVYTSSASFIASDRKRKPKSGLGKGVAWNTHVLTQQGWISGYVVRMNQHGKFIRVNGHEIKVVPFRGAPMRKHGETFIQKGMTISDCSLKEHPLSRDRLQVGED